MMSQIVFVLAIMSIVTILILSFRALVIADFDFFPPPRKDSWQYRIFWVLFRVMFIGLIYLSFSEFDSLPVFDPWIRYCVWLPLIVAGFGAATYLTGKLGWANAHGEKIGLVVSGCYRWSRNPIYVASFVGMIGWVFFVNSPYVNIILSLWALMYFLAPFLEEQWLERMYGEKFLVYKKETSRFFGFPKQ